MRFFAETYKLDVLLGSDSSVYRVFIFVLLFGFVSCLSV